jgi:hypothetical protein
MSALPNEVELIRVPGGIHAESILAALRGSGIPARAHGEAVGAIYGLTLDGLGEVSIFVPEECLDRARTVLEAGEQGELEIGDHEATEGAKPDGD